MLSLDLGLVLVTHRVLVVLAVLQVVLGTCRGMVFSVGTLVGLVVDALLLEDILSLKEGPG